MPGLSTTAGQLAADASGFFERLAKGAADLVKRAGRASAEAVSPANIFVPGGIPAIKAATKATTAAGEGVKNIGTTVKTVGQGVARGFSWATFLIVVIGGLVLLAYLKPLMPRTED